MKKMLPIVCLLLISSAGFSQANKQVHQVNPKWKLGDHKKVHTGSVSKIYINDSLINHTEAEGRYSLQVIDTVKNYTLLYSNEAYSAGFEAKSSNPVMDSAINNIAGIIQQIEKETQAFKYELLVDKSTGLAFKVKNDDQYLKMLEQVTSSLIETLGKKKGKTANQIDSMKQKIVAYFRQEEPKILETAINEFNYLMQAYSFKYSHNSTISQKAMVHDVNALGEFGGIEMPAVLTISSKQEKDNLVIETDTDYDKDFLLGQIKLKYQNMASLTAPDIFLSEKAKAIFTIKDHWMVLHRSDVVFKMKEVKVVNQTVVRFD